jgi:hypothetical protein
MPYSSGSWGPDAQARSKARLKYFEIYSKSKYKLHKEQIMQRNKKYYLKNKENINLKGKMEYEKHKENFQLWYQQHKEEMKQRNKEYYLNHRTSKKPYNPIRRD